MINQCTFIGNLGSDPTNMAVESGSITKFNIACNRKWTSKDGEKKEDTQWIRIATFGKTADTCSKYLKKGSQVFVQGRMHNYEYDKDGETRYGTEIIANEVKFLGGKTASEHTSSDVPSLDANDSMPF